MRGTLRFLQLISIMLWVGGLAFFAFVLAPLAFHVLPSVHEAGLIVGATLGRFDRVALVCGLVFLLATGLLFRSAPHRIKGRYEIQLLLAAVMMLATAYIEWKLMPAMESDRVLAGGDIDKAEKTNPARIHFEKLHARSEKADGTVFFLGIGVLFLMSREQGGLPFDENSTAR